MPWNINVFHVHCKLQPQYYHTKSLTDDDPFEVPKALGILRTISSSCLLTVNTLVGRIQDNHERIKAKIAKKKKSEAQYYENRYGFDEQTLTGATYPN